MLEKILIHKYKRVCVCHEAERMGRRVVVLIQVRDTVIIFTFCCRIIVIITAFSWGLNTVVCLWLEKRWEAATAAVSRSCLMVKAGKQPVAVLCSQVVSC